MNLILGNHGNHGDGCAGYLLLDDLGTDLAPQLLQGMSAKICDSLDQLNSLRSEKEEVEQATRMGHKTGVGSLETQPSAEQGIDKATRGIDQLRKEWQDDVRSFHEAESQFLAARKAGKSMEVSPEQRQALGERRECLARTQEQLAMLETAAGTALMQHVNSC